MEPNGNNDSTKEVSADKIQGLKTSTSEHNELFTGKKIYYFSPESWFVEATLTDYEFEDERINKQEDTGGAETVDEQINEQEASSEAETVDEEIQLLENDMVSDSFNQPSQTNHKKIIWLLIGAIVLFAIITAILMVIFTIDEFGLNAALIQPTAAFNLFEL